MSRLYRVTHRTEYRYSAPVTNSYGRGHLTPRPTPNQRCLRSEIDIDPPPVDRSTAPDAYGNVSTFFQVTERHDRLTVTAISVVEVDRPDGARYCSPAALAPWESARPRGPQGAFACEFSLDLCPPEIDEAVRAYAAPSFPPGRPLIEAVADLNGRIFADFTYRSGSTTVSTRVGEVLAAREGVCQDFARLAIACLRAQGLAASYVSGYLATDPAPGQDRVFGIDATHAWAAVWTPDGEWVGFDPTNDQWADERYVTVAWGRDYADVPPLRGIIYTDSEHSVIEVSVDVAPIDDRASSDRVSDDM